MLPSCPRPVLLERLFADEQKAPLQTLQSASKTETAKKIPLLAAHIAATKSCCLSRWLTLRPRLRQIRDGSTILTGKGRLGPAEVFDAEAIGALEGLKAALSLPDTGRIFFCLDNLATPRCLRGTPSDSSQDVFLEFQSLARQHGSVEVHWIPNHADIPGNEEADALAKAGASLPEPAENTRR
ncbi:hypothetical protein HIM_10250 [Hirsutella minnesotensis 3608]|uniref:RNase H type-1 domain-containing protein n=1 Tax=Hirsutella minnesotensis 3608 TaxID=1043627 RepID=A0A0F8A2H2_9HYPO|nr:hypothetical protein HIM_10250 [Hirsutella minnesotensis 3608]